MNPKENQCCENCSFPETMLGLDGKCWCRCHQTPPPSSLEDASASKCNHPLGVPHSISDRSFLLKEIVESCEGMKRDILLADNNQDYALDGEWNTALDNIITKIREML